MCLSHRGKVCPSGPGRAKEEGRSVCEECERKISPGRSHVRRGGTPPLVGRRVAARRPQREPGGGRRRDTEQLARGGAHELAALDAPVAAAVQDGGLEEGCLFLRRELERRDVAPAGREAGGVGAVA